MCLKKKEKNVWWWHRREEEKTAEKSWQCVKKALSELKLMSRNKTETNVRKGKEKENLRKSQNHLTRWNYVTINIGCVCNYLETIINFYCFVVRKEEKTGKRRKTSQSFCNIKRFCFGRIGKLEMRLDEYQTLKWNAIQTRIQDFFNFNVSKASSKAKLENHIFLSDFSIFTLNTKPTKTQF